MTRKKPFIVLEGVEGSGKSTQSLLLSERLALEGIDNLLVREPGSTNTGEKIRNLILQATELNPLSELFLFSALGSVSNIPILILNNTQHFFLVRIIRIIRISTF